MATITIILADGRTIECEADLKVELPTPQAAQVASPVLKVELPPHQVARIASLFDDAGTSDVQSLDQGTSTRSTRPHQMQTSRPLGAWLRSFLRLPGIRIERCEVCDSRTLRWHDVGLTRY